MYAKVHNLWANTLPVVLVRGLDDDPLFKDVWHEVGLITARFPGGHGVADRSSMLFAHVQLSPDECAEFKGIPVVMNLEEDWLARYSLQDESIAQHIGHAR